MTFNVLPFWIIGALCGAGFGLLVLFVKGGYPPYLRRTLEYLGTANLCLGASYLARISGLWAGQFVFDVFSSTLVVICLSLEYVAICALKRRAPRAVWSFAPPAITFALCIWFAFVVRNITVQLILVNSTVMVMLFVLAIELMKSEEEARPLVDTLPAGAYLLLGFATCVDLIDYLRTARFSVEYNFNTPRSFLYNTAAIVTEGVVLPLFLLMVSERLNRDLVVKAMRDPLTGLYNRWAFEDIAFRELSGSARTGQSLALILFDVDCLKQINDRHVHPAGDAAIVAASAALCGSLRNEDFLCWWGGDGFCALLPRAEQEQAEGVVKRVNQSLTRVNLQTDGKTLPLTISSGVATGDGETQDFAALLKRADEALYRAKQTRLNRCEMAAASKTT